jgi:hypothetical protein
MKTIASVAVAGMLAVSSFAAATTDASAGGKHWKRHYPHHHYHSRGGWGPGAAVATGALLGLTIGALAAPRYYEPPPVRYYDAPPSPPRGYTYSAQHVSWCSDRYRSYDAYDNSWVDYDGFARQCVSPF